MDLRLATHAISDDLLKANGIDITNTHGTLLIGCFLSCVVYGATCLQVFLYFARYEHDARHHKAMVFILWLVDTANQIITLKSQWRPLILEYGRVAGLSEIQPELIHHPWLFAIVTVSVQLFYIHRIHVFSGRKHALALAGMIMLTISQPVIVIVWSIIVYRPGYNGSRLNLPTVVKLGVALRAISFAEDLLLSGTLIYFVMRRGLPSFSK
jgi:hypothetical protein